jgi:hypothetical protein
LTGDVPRLARGELPPPLDDASDADALDRFHRGHQLA